MQQETSKFSLQNLSQSFGGFLKLTNWINAVAESSFFLSLSYLYLYKVSDRSLEPTQGFSPQWIKVKCLDQLGQGQVSCCFWENWDLFHCLPKSRSLLDSHSHKPCNESFLFFAVISLWNVTQADFPWPLLFRKLIMLTWALSLVATEA